MTDRSLTPVERVQRLRWPALALAIAGAIVCILAVIFSRHDFFRAYLFSWLFWLGITLGGLVLVMLHNLTGGGWGHTVRRIGEAASLTLPLWIILFIPIILGMRDLYIWTHADALAASDVLRHREPYLNIPFFIVRAAIYFAIWLFLTIAMHRWNLRVEATGDEAAETKIRRWSGAGLLLYLLTMSHAAIDWIMSRDIQFYSTAFGFVVTVGQTLSALAFIIIVMGLIGRWVRDDQKPLAQAVRPGILNDIGNVLLTLVILWAYVSFMQFLVIWTGNTGEDNPYFLQRGLGAPSVWRWIGLALVALHFFVPFFLLLFRAAKQYLPTLVTIAAILLAMHLVMEYWLVAPSGAHRGPMWNLTWPDVVIPFALGAIWLAAFVWLLPARLAAAAGAVATEIRGAEHA